MNYRTLTARALTVLSLAISQSSFGQTDNLVAVARPNTAGAAASFGYTAPATTASQAVSAIVEEGFTRSYPQATNATWTRIDKGFQVSFTSGGQPTTATFNDNGKFCYAISELGAAQIPAEVAAFAKDHYPAHKLIRAISIRDNVKTVYQTIIQHGTDYITIKSLGEDLEVSVVKGK